VRKEWQAVRHGVLERDGWCCQHCGDRRRLEVHHKLRVADHPELAFEPSNCLTLCGPCHTIETNRELGNKPNPERAAWRKSVAELATTTSSEGVQNA
jgi:5-methylcytosine-specific restriction endonuclease McrA